MKKLRFSILFISAILLIGLIGAIPFLSEKEDLDPFEIVRKDDTSIRIRPYERDGQLFCFLPSGMRAEDCRIEAEKNVHIDGQPLAEYDLSRFETGKEYTLQYRGKEYPLVFYQSENVPTMYLHTVQRDRDYLDSDKNHELDVQVVLYDESGKLLVRNLKGNIRGRGNNSWNQEKKAYNLKFEEKTDHLEMGEAKKWALIADASDPSHLNNKVVNEFAASTGLEWTPECRYVDVYLNGSYHGLYLISERIEDDPERFVLNNGEVLLKRELTSRLASLNDGFLSELGNAIEVIEPESLTPTRKEETVSKVNEMEESLADLDSDRWQEEIDLDSWARCYLIDELFDNLDAGIASAYFSIQNDGKFYRGPVWDYDVLRWDVPRSIIAASPYRHPYSRNDYYYLLNQREEFRSRVRELLNSEFMPLIEEFCDHRIKEIDGEITQARYLDSLRWNYSIEADAESFADYLKEKSAFLNEYLSDPKRYCIIQIQVDSFYRSFITEKGKTIADAYDIDPSLYTGKEWIDADEGSDFDLHSPIEKNIRLDAKTEETGESETVYSWRDFGLFNLLFPVLTVLLMAYLIMKLRRNNG